MHGRHCGLQTTLSSGQKNHEGHESTARKTDCKRPQSLNQLLVLCLRWIKVTESVDQSAHNMLSPSIVLGLLLASFSHFNVASTETSCYLTLAKPQAQAGAWDPAAKLPVWELEKIADEGQSTGPQFGQCMLHTCRCDRCGKKLSNM